VDLVNQLVWSGPACSDKADKMPKMLSSPGAVIVAGAPQDDAIALAAR
jgi:hypothetical protein